MNAMGFFLGGGVVVCLFVCSNHCYFVMVSDFIFLWVLFVYVCVWCVSCILFFFFIYFLLACLFSREKKGMELGGYEGKEENGKSKSECIIFKFFQ